jgi:RNA polymerase sigma-70 factor (ECF subfamily)
MSRNITAHCCIIPEIDHFSSPFFDRITSFILAPGPGLMVIEDKELIARFLQGDTQAFNQLVSKWHRPITNFILRYMGNHDDAQELSQETFTSVYEKLHSLKDWDRFSSWMFTIALNHCRMRLRKQQARPVVALEEKTNENNEQIEHYVSLTSNSSFSPEESFSKDEMAQVVRSALSRLDQKQKEVIVLKEYTGLKFSEIADILDTPLSTIKSRMYIGMENLKKEILKIIRPYR